MGDDLKTLLIGDLKQVIDETGRAIDRIKRDHPDTDDWYRLRYHDGTYILASILTVRAQALVALAHLTT